MLNFDALRPCRGNFNQVSFFLSFLFFYYFLQFIYVLFLTKQIHIAFQYLI